MAGDPVTGLEILIPPVAKTVASAIAGEAAKKLWHKVSGSAEAKALVEPVALAFVRAIEASRTDDRADEVDWWGKSGTRLLAPFTDPKVAEWVMASSLAAPEDPAATQGTLIGALEHRMHDFAVWPRNWTSTRSSSCACCPARSSTR
jgi:hypothetical protein